MHMAKYVNSLYIIFLIFFSLFINLPLCFHYWFGKGEDVGDGNSKGSDARNGNVKTKEEGKKEKGQKNLNEV